MDTNSTECPSVLIALQVVYMYCPRNRRIFAYVDMKYVHMVCTYMYNRELSSLGEFQIYFRRAYLE